MDASKFNVIKDRARRLIQMDNAGEIDRIAEQKRREGTLSGNADGDINYNPTSSSQIITEDTYSYDEAPLQFNTPSSKKLPKEIVESFQKKTIDTTSFAPETSILDTMGIKPTKPQKSARTQINEVKTNTNVSNGNGNIDYSLIRMIVEESVKKYMSAYTKKILSESVSTNSSHNPVHTIQMGDKFNFVTKNGDLYEAQLVFKKNLKEK